jgi:hypothetical protein
MPAKKGERPFLFDPKFGSLAFLAYRGAEWKACIRGTMCLLSFTNVLQVRLAAKLSNGPTEKNTDTASSQ